MIIDHAAGKSHAAILLGGMQIADGDGAEKIVTAELCQKATIVLNSLEYFQLEIFGLS